MQRAVQIFHIDERESHSPLIEKVWRSKSVPHEAFISVAISRWEIVFWRQAGRMHVTLRGPETAASAAPIPADAAFFGVQFRPGAFMPRLPVDGLVDGAMSLPLGAGNSFRLIGSAWEIPTYDNVEVFVNRLARQDLIVTDPVVVAALQNQTTGLSRRSVERRVRRATGLTLGAIRQIERASAAAALLDEGAGIAETVARAAYADQAHLTRSLKRLMGQTPAQIVRQAPAAVSLSFKTGERQRG